MARRDLDLGEGYAAALLSWSRDVRAALRRLDPTQRKVVQLIYFERRTQQQTALELGLPLRTVSRSLATAMQALALIMLSPGPDPKA